MFPLVLSNVKRIYLEPASRCYIFLASTNKNFFKNDFRRYCKQSEEKTRSSLTNINRKSEVGTPITYKTVKETTKTVSYLGVIVIGIGVTGILFYAIFKELFSSKSPNNVYTAALDKCSSEPRVQNALGEPIKGYGEETRRGRRRHVSHMEYQKDGINYLRMKFYLQGLRRKGTVHLEMKENSSGKYEYRYLFVQLDSHPRETIILEDNRSPDQSIALPSSFVTL